MGLFNTITNAIFPERKQKNNYTRGNDFLKYGNRNTLYPTWSEVKLTEMDVYKGYAYAAIQKRSNKVAKLAKENLRTWTNDTTLAKMSKYNMTPTHPYLRIIEGSTKFSQKKFWKDISIYLDLVGVYYLGVVRGHQELVDGSEIYGDVKEFILLNPLEIKRVVNKSGEVAGYVEQKPDGRTREWQKHQIIEMRELNPKDEDKLYSMVSAGKESIYTINQATDYARQTINGNLNAPGILTTDVVLQDEDFANFVARIKNSQKGEPLFANGSGAINWQPMQINLDQAALLNIKSGSRDEFFAVSGTSKTVLGIEESGTTRETARTQTELFLSDAVEPRVEDIIDFLNLDYKTKYPAQYKTYGYLIELVSSSTRDYDTDIKALQLKREEYQLAQDMIDMGYTKESSIQYAKGEIDLDQIQQIDFGELQKELEAERSDEGSDTPQDPEQPEDSQESTEEQSEEKEQTNDSQALKVLENEDGELAFKEEFNGWLAGVVKPIEVRKRLKAIGKIKYLVEGDEIKDFSNVPAEDVPHFTLMYGLKDQPYEIKDLIDGAINGLKEVSIKKISHFELDYANCLVAILDKTPELLKARNNLEKLPHQQEEFGFSNPHITLAYIDKGEDMKPYYELFEDLPGQILDVVAIDYGKGYEEGLYKKIANDDTEEHHYEDSEHDHEENFHTHEDGSICTHCHETPKIETYHNDLSEEDSEILDGAYKTFINQIRQIQKTAINKAISKVTVNSFEEEDILESEDKEEIQNKLEEAVKDYWWIILPIFANTLFGQRNNQFKTNRNFIFSQEIKDKVLANAAKVSQGHIQTVIGNILVASNRAYKNILEDLATNLITEAYDKNPEKFSEYFETKPTEVQIKKALHSTDILEKNRKIYEKANRMVTDGYSRGEIIKAIRAEYNNLSTKRATVIARNETSRAFVNSQYQADLQFLNSIGKMDLAYKELYSRSGDPCPVCKEIINQGPVPFTKPFIALGETINTVVNGKESSFTANYEDIDGGVVHPQCTCQYRLIIKDEHNGLVSKYNSLETKEQGVLNDKVK
jgi:phage portal protein|nr:MAG TPA: portal protein [Caudoviricetes sp.]